MMHLLLYCYPDKVFAAFKKKKKTNLQPTTKHPHSTRNNFFENTSLGIQTPLPQQHEQWTTAQICRLGFEAYLSLCLIAIHLEKPPLLNIRSVCPFHQLM